MSQNNVTEPVAKIATVWAAIGITSWAEAASFLAFIYSLVLIGEWAWKKIVRPLLVARGYLRADRRRGDGDK